MSSAPVETFWLRPSVAALRWLLAGHGVAWLAVAAWDGPAALRWLLALGVGVSLARCLAAARPVRIAVGAGGWSMSDSRGRTRQGAHPVSFRMLPGVTCVSFRGGFATSVALFDDAFGTGDAARLRAVLRHRKPAPAC